MDELLFSQKVFASLEELLDGSTICQQREAATRSSGNTGQSRRHSAKMNDLIFGESVTGLKGHWANPGLSKSDVSEPGSGVGASTLVVRVECSTLPVGPGQQSAVMRCWLLTDSISKEDKLLRSCALRCEYVATPGCVGLPPPFMQKFWKDAVKFLWRHVDLLRSVTRLCFLQRSGLFLMAVIIKTPVVVGEITLIDAL
ncbi:unnamed protein product [Ranitomeya imitator]|uniref:Uncharacterized protein n=1 Tax=Ranitomeya imitator TaxID=111125 RepID=A0ABN9M071_9NEOB|nr:unnamed protein product [Ranitomeya imitator]